MRSSIRKLKRTVCVVALVGSIALMPAAASGADPVGHVTQYPIGSPTKSGIADLLAAPDGYVWFAEFYANQIGRISTTGTITQFAQGVPANAGPRGLAVGPDLNLWFTEVNTDGIGRITPAGEITSFTNGITAGAQPQFITLGPDGSPARLDITFIR